MESPGTRQALLETARTLFAERGFDGTSVRAITAAAGANLGAVTYHFGTKDALYGAVVSESLGPFAAALVEAARRPGTPLDRVEAVVRIHFEHMATHPELAQLMLRSVLRVGAPPEPALQTMRAIHGALIELVRDGQADGSIRDGDPVLMALTLVSPSVHLVIMQRTLRQNVGIDLTDPAQRAQTLDYLVRFVRGGVAQHGPAS